MNQQKKLLSLFASGLLLGSVIGTANAGSSSDTVKDFKCGPGCQYLLVGWMVDWCEHHMPGAKQDKAKVDPHKDKWHRSASQALPCDEKCRADLTAWAKNWCYKNVKHGYDKK